MSISSTSRNLFSTASRQFSSSSRCSAIRAERDVEASQKGTTSRSIAASFNMDRLEVYQFDDATSLGHLRLQKIQEVNDLIRKVDVDRAVLRAQAKPFQKPKGSIKVTSTIDLSNPVSPYHNKSVLLAPVSKLPLKGASAIHRLKLLAGPRWSPSPPGRYENEVDESTSSGEGSEGREGWVRISEETWKEGRMNRKSASDILERLVEAANDPKSPIPKDTPLDTRHLLSRQLKKSNRSGGHIWRRAEAMKSRKEVVGGVKGFPVEWV